MSNSALYDEFRKKYPVFRYTGYSIREEDNSWVITYDFSVDGLTEFHPSWTIGFNGSMTKNADDPVLRGLAFSLGMVELVSYWKAACSPDVYVSAAYLSSAQIEWWKKLYLKGLGEFFYRNGITPEADFMNIICECEPGSSKAAAENALDDNRVLVPIGGGKDSAVSLEILPKSAERYCYIINPRGATLNTVTASGISEDHVIKIKRSLDQELLRLNKEGFLNGHTPFSALVAFSSVMIAYLNGIKYVALSNESSANESTVLGMDVNHQYSKSFEFEKDFREYESEYVGSGVEYFSLLRPLTEMGIAKIFSHLKPYHYVFRSCNVGSKADIWCAKCPKCLFVYIILSPFVGKDELVKIFGHDMLDDPDMQTIFEELLGIRPEKPFECVGRYDEVQAAVQELIRQLKAENKPLPCLLEHYLSLDIKEEYDINAICSSFDSNNMIPEKFTAAVKEAVEKYIL